MRGMSISETVRPVEPKMNLDVGRLNPREAVQLLGLTVGALCVVPFAALLAWVAWPDVYGSWSAVRLMFAVFGLVLAALAFLVACVVYYLMIVDWFDYRTRLADWHNAALVAIESTGGVERHTDITEWELSPSVALHVLAAALSVHRRVAEGVATPWAVRKLEGPLMVGGVRLLDVSSSAAVDLANNFATLGLVAGRGDRKAGEWVPKNETEVVELVAQNWRKVR